MWAWEQGFRTNKVAKIKEVEIKIMGEWIKTEDRLPDKGKFVEVKAKPFEGTTGHAVLVDTEWGTTEWLYAGMINMAIDMITEWRECDG